MSKSHWTHDYINKLVATGITSGTSNTPYSPNNPVTRTQMVVFISRVLEYQKNGSIPEEPIEDKEVVSNNVNKQLMEDVLKGLMRYEKPSKSIIPILSMRIQIVVISFTRHDIICPRNP